MPRLASLCTVFALCFLSATKASACDFRCEAIKLVIGSIVSGLVGFAADKAFAALDDASAAPSEKQVTQENVAFCPNGQRVDAARDSVCGISLAQIPPAVQRFAKAPIVNLYCPDGEKYRVIDISSLDWSCKKLRRYKSILLESGDKVAVYCGTALRLHANVDKFDGSVSCQELLTYHNLFSLSSY